MSTIYFTQNKFIDISQKQLICGTINVDDLLNLTKFLNIYNGININLKTITSITFEKERR